mmetsp:Transcript_156469/g.502068  ORF Transcript_156469/g.502068 Transcript_156469/m.502068 type:complete len:565 (+) Transcript_156469:167-1861(+)
MQLTNPRVAGLALLLSILAWYLRDWSYSLVEGQDFSDPPCVQADASTSTQCQRFCRCDLSRATWHEDGGREWCHLLPDTGCIFGDGVPRMVAAATAPCDWVSGRGSLQLRLKAARDSEKRCGPPAEACPLDRGAMFSRALAPLEGGDAPEPVAARLRELASLLHGEGYNRSTLLRLARDHGQTGYALPALGQLSTPPKDAGPVINDLVWLFGVGAPLPRDKVESILTIGVLQALVSLGVLLIWGDLVFAAVQIFPVEGALFFTDLPLWKTFCDSIYQLGDDSLALAVASKSGVAALRGETLRILDVCTGSGVQGITAALHATKAGLNVELTLVDINPRARRFVAANLILNDVQGAFLESDLSQGPVAAEARYDFILANPPFWPAEGKQLFQFGGADGERVTSQIVSGLLPKLNVAGLMYIVTPVFNEQYILSRLQSWGVDRWTMGTLVLHSSSLNLDELVSHGGYGAISRRTLSAAGIESGSVHGLIMVRNCMWGHATESEPDLWTALMGCGQQEEASWKVCLKRSGADLRDRVLSRIRSFSVCSKADDQRRASAAAAMPPTEE